MNLSYGRVGRTLSQETFRKFWNNFDFVLPIIYDIRIIIWRISFFANIFEWAENPALLEVSDRHENGWFYAFHWRVNGRLIFPFIELLRYTKKWSFPLSISSVNVKKFTFTKEILNGKLDFSCSARWGTNLYILSVAILIYIFLNEITYFKQLITHLLSR